MMRPLFITGIGTDVGKTVSAAIVTEALGADYWKPIQAGFDQGTDSEWVAARISGAAGRIHPEAYKLVMPASPHIAARRENVIIEIPKIVGQYRGYVTENAQAGQGSEGEWPSSGGGEADRGNEQERNEPGGESLSDDARLDNKWTVIEGAGGLFVPLNDDEFVIDLAVAIGGPVILVSRNYLGSINHSIMTAALCKSCNIPVAGWIFNDHYLDYEDEIVRWTGIPAIASIPMSPDPDAAFIREQAGRIRDSLLRHLRPFGVPLPE